MPNPLDRDTNDNATPDDDELEGDDDDGEEVDGDGDGDGDPDGDELEGDDDDEGTEAIDDAGDARENDSNVGGLRAFLLALELGEPFAISGDIEIIEAKIIVQHEAGPHAGKKFRVDLLNPKVKHSPYDGSAFTHALIVAPVGDPEIVLDVVSHILEANGHEAP